MNSLTRLAILFVTFGLYVGCSPVSFSLDDSKCKDQGCVVVDGKYVFKYAATAGYGKVDILIVNDNSASMSFEQARLAPRFQNFIQDLDSRNIDYRIAMTTTDVSSSTQLLSFGSGVPFLTPQTTNREALFNSTIQRPETLACEKFIADWIRNNGGNAGSINSTQYSAAYAQKCPSGDERGVYAANKVIDSNPSSFIRSDAHLSIIFLSDEDERSGLYTSNNEYRLEQQDQPKYLISNVKAKLGDAKFDSLSIHAIVVKDSACLGQQNSQALENYAPTKGLVNGSIGNVYLSFTNQGWGNSADICSSDYTSQLGQIRADLTDRIKDIMLSCSNPTDLIVTVSGSAVSHSVEGKILKFNQYLEPGTAVTLSYKCNSLN